MPPAVFTLGASEHDAISSPSTDLSSRFSICSELSLVTLLTVPCESIHIHRVLSLALVAAGDSYGLNCGELKKRFSESCLQAGSVEMEPQLL